jgi:hypothetical protein
MQDWMFGVYAASGFAPAVCFGAVGGRCGHFNSVFCQPIMAKL